MVGDDARLVTVRRSFQDLQVKCSLAGYEAIGQSAKSTTKALVMGNAIIGGAIGVGVDIASGAAYDYPSAISVELSRKLTGPGGQPLPPAALPPPAATLARGTRLVFADSDALSLARLSELELVLSGVDDGQVAFNEGRIVTRLDGTPVNGLAHNTMVYGVGPADLRAHGPWRGRFKAAGILEDVPATLTLLRRQSKTISGIRFDAVRLRVEGHASRSQVGGFMNPNQGAAFEGEMLVDVATGIVLEVEIRCRHPAYAVRRELVRLTPPTS